MKFLFRINNPTTYLVSEQIIYQRNLNSSDCVFITSTNQLLNKVKEKHNNVTTISEDWVEISKNLPRSWAKYVRTIFVVLRSTTFKNYELFIPHSSSLFLQLLIRLPFCKRFNYLEEGALSYWFHKRTVNQEMLLAIPFKNKIWPMLNHFGLLPHLMARFEKGQNKFYCLSEHAFPFIEESKIVFNPKKRRDEFVRYNNSYILCPSRASELNQISLNNEIELIKQVFDKIPIHSKVYLNFHPRQNQQKKNAIKELIESYKGHLISILEDNVIVEDILISSKNVTVISDISSLLIYGIVFNQSSTSYLDSFNKLSITKFSKEEKFPKFSLKKIEFI